MLQFRFILYIVFVNACYAQNPYPQDYFTKPLDIPLVLSGTFSELRSNHFHSGLDIKTNKREGLDILASADGYVSRIKISLRGYGKALYITHPNGYTTVYAHLKRFSPAIEAYVKSKQYEQETFEIELFPKYNELKVAKNEVVALSGNTGGSSGPHLHYEIRDKKERPVNPMLFGIKIKDSKKPLVLAAFAYAVNDTSHINGKQERQKLRLYKTRDGNLKSEPLNAFGKIGIGIVSYDQQDLAINKNGVFNIESFFNGNKVFELDFSKFSFSETKHLNRLIDYQYFKTKKSRIQKLFVEENNPLSLYKNTVDNGFITVEDKSASIVKVKIRDFENNIIWLTIPLKGKKKNNIIKTKTAVTDYYVYTDQALSLNKNHISAYFPTHTFYDNFYIDFKVRGDTLKLHKPTIPAKKNFTIRYDISTYNEDDKDQLFIARLTGKKKYINYVKTIKEENTLICNTKTLGTYLLASDVENPKISPINFENEKWISKLQYLKVKISDNLSGISNYRATVNGKWILMEYNPKKKMLIHDFNDHKILDTKNNLKIIVTDNVGNNSTFEAIFYRKTQHD